MKKRKLQIENIESRKWARNELVQPFLKWAGGKRQLLPEIRKLVPRKFKRYFEPFVGAGAVFLDLQHGDVIINDYNAELVNCYEVIQASPEELISQALSYKHTSEEFYRIRQLDRSEDFSKLTDVSRAARILYLNKTCYNGLFRVNSRGEFNVPFGNYQNPRIVDPAAIRAISEYLNANNVRILNGDFEEAVRDAGKGDFVYFDPPYDPVSDTSSFTGYSLNSFGKHEQVRLRKLCEDLTDRGCYVLISNSATDFIRNEYGSSAEFTVKEVEAARNINSVGSSRGKINELLIYNNYELRD